MSPFTLYLASILALVLGWLTLRWLLARLRLVKRTRLYNAPFKTEWRALLQQRITAYHRLPEPLRDALHARINYFIAEKEFVGRGGLVVDDDVRVTIAAQACLLVLSEQGDIFPGFKTILVYPDTFYSDNEYEQDGVVTRERDHRAGESWHRGPVVLSWGDVVRGAAHEDDGFNVVLHEFAHKLDEQNMAVNGQPLLHEHDHYADWVRVMNSEYQAFMKRVESRENSVLDAYGAHSPPEFFAVASESFFEKPRQMREKLPELYRQLQRFYRLDPASWQEPGEA